MATTNDLRPKMPDAREEDGLPASAFQLRLAAAVVEKLIERNGGGGVANAFWDEDAFDSIENQEEYLDPDLWDPDEEVLPEAKEIEWNLYECN